MLRLHALLGGIAIAACVTAAMADAPADIALIVDRDEEAVSLFLSLPLDGLEPALGLPSEALRDSSGLFPIGVFQQEGTAALAADVIAGVDLSLDGRAAEFPPMSMMLHERALSLPFETPLDGWTAMSVCGVDGPDGAAADSDVQLYAGYTAYPASGDAVLRLALPNDAPVELTVRDHWAGQVLAERRMTLLPGETLDLAIPADFAPGGSIENAARWGGILLSVIALAAFLALVLHRTGLARRRPGSA